MQIQVNNIYLNYEVTGSGRPLILLHGNGEDHKIFDEAVSQLKSQFTCYAVDSRDHGDSSPCPELHYQDMADDMIAFMDQLDLRNVLFFGFSDGGIIGLLCAMKTDRITTLVAAGANATPDGVKPMLKRFMKLISRFTLDSKIRLMLNEPHITENDLRSIKAKTLVLAGEKDVVTDHETKFIAANIPGATLRFVKGEGHGSYIVHSTKFVKYVVYADRMMK